MPQWLTVDERSFRVRDLLKTLPVQTYRTAEFGRIEIHSDGTCYQITTMK